MTEVDKHTEMEVESVELSTQASHNHNAVIVAPTSKPQEVPVSAQTEDQGGGRKEMEPRSEIWQHFIKIKDDKGIVKTARCKYCHRNMKAEAGRHGTSSLKRHFVVCKRNPNKFNKDPSQGILQATHCEELFEEFGKAKQAASSKTNVTIKIGSNSIDLGTSTI